MTKPTIPQLPVPMLTEVVQVNGSLRPVVLPWASPKKDSPSSQSGTLGPDPQALADQVIARVQMRLAEMMPELMRNAVDEVLREHVAADSQSPSRPK